MFHLEEGSVGGWHLEHGEHGGHCNPPWVIVGELGDQLFSATCPGGKLGIFHLLCLGFGGGHGVARWTCLGVNGIGLGQEEWVNKTKQDKTKQVLAFSLTIASIFSLSLSTLLCLCSTIWPILYGLITDRVVRYCCQNPNFKNICTIKKYKYKDL